MGSSVSTVRSEYCKDDISMGEWCMVDRGVEMMEKEDLHGNLSGILAPIELSLSVLFPLLIWLIFKYDTYKEFPGSMYRWVIILDWIYGIFMGPFRWLKGNPFYSSMATPSDSSGCRFAVFIDTFCQMGLLYTNTIIITSVFYGIYFRQSWANNKDLYYKYTVRGFWGLTLPISIITVTADVHNYVGWCTADSVAVIIKQLTWFLIIVVQVTMFVPTNYIIYKSSCRNLIANGTYFRFLGVVLTEIIGIFPLMIVEFMGVSRKVVPRWIMVCVIWLFPVAHILDIILFSMKLWPLLLANFETATSFRKFIAVLVRDSVDGSEHTDDGEQAKFEVAEGSVGGSQNTFDSSEMSFYSSEEGSERGSEFTAEGSFSNDDFDAASVASEGGQVAWKQFQQKKGYGSIFDRIPFWLHLSITIFVPFILLVLVSLVMLLDYNDQINSSNRIRADIKLTSKMSNFVHESQKERGATGVFLGSKGAKFECEIQAQYLLTSEQKNHLQYYLDEEFANVRLVTKATFLHALIFMLGIEEHREGVQAQTTAKNVGIGFYTSMNMYFIGVVAEVCRDSKLGVTIQHKMFANLAFFMGKEQAGIERAKGTGPFHTEKWLTNQAYRSFIEVISKQDTFLWFYEKYVEGTDREFYDEKMDDISVTNSADMRNILKGANATLLAIGQSGEWFRNMTAKINLIRDVESALAKALGNDAKDVVDLSTNDMLTVVGTLAAVLIIDGMMILGLARTSKTLKTYKLNKRTKKKGMVSNTWIVKIINSIINMNFIYQILTSVMGSGLSLIVISWLLLKDQIATSQSASATLENMYLQRYFSDYIHEVQKERGATGVYMGSSGKEFVVELASQKELTDKMKAHYNQFLLEYVDFENLKDYEAWVSLRDDYFANLNENRQQSSKLAIPASTSLGFYTKHNGKIVNIASEIARRASGDSIESRLLALLGFMYMKEKAGNERAVGSVGFSSNGWGGLHNFQKFISLVSFQTASSTFFYTFGTEQQIAMFEQTAFLKGSRVSTEMREKGLTNLEAQMRAVDGGQWYGNITQKINAWRLVEEKIADDLEVFFSALDQMVNSFLVGIVIMVISLLIISIWVIQKGIRMVLNSRAYISYQERLAFDRNNKDGKVASAEVKTGDNNNTSVAV